MAPQSAQTLPVGDKGLDEYVARDPDVDALFLERLETFMDKCIGDIRAFSERELRPFEETRRCVAEWHAKHLFQSSLSSATDQTRANRHDYVRSVLMNTSRVLESLAETAGVQSFLLSVDLRDEQDSGFLGGSVHGREFWRTLRGGGDYGAKAFKQYCRKNDPGVHDSGSDSLSETKATSAAHLPAASSSNSAKNIKTALYETVRRALKSASGVRNAEMKWTNPERLDVYGVRLVGWPPEIPSHNPSTLRVNQNRQLLEAFKTGVARFERLPTAIPPASIPETEGENNGDESDDFSWAYDPDVSPTISPKPPPVIAPNKAESRSSSPRQAPVSLASTRGNSPLSQTGSSFETWDIYSSTFNPQVEADEQDGGLVRPRKRPRSEEPHGLDSDLQ